MRRKHLHGNGREKVHPWHLLRVFFLYLLLMSAAAAWIDYTSYGVFNPLWMALLAFLAAVLASSLHWRSFHRNRIDDLADGDL